MQRYNILWADDEIDLLKPHILFLNNKGYDVTPVNSGPDAIDECQKNIYDVVFLDENMPGMTGLETLNHIKSLRPNLPVVMITKSEEEHIMEEAIGARIADYLIKPVNPNQILSSVKKILENKRLISERTNISYQQDFQKISMVFNDRIDFEEWIDVYKKLVYWETEIDKTEDRSMSEVLETQKEEANANFAKFISDNYESWLNDPEGKTPLLSHQILKRKVFPLLEEEEPIFFIVIDNLRADQWTAIESVVLDYFIREKEEYYYSILPTTTAYSRNAIFSGLMPLEMSSSHADIWVGESQEGGKNNHEDEFLARLLDRNHLDIKYSYHKIKNLSQGRQLAASINNLMSNKFNTIVYNFVDMLSHARTEMEMIRELAPDESAYRSITRSWFIHSPLFEILKKLSQKKVKVIITTDHGTIRVKRPFKIVGDKNTNTNLRYKQGKNLAFEEDGVYVVRKPENIRLPRLNVSTSYVFAMKDNFFAYPNNFNYYVKYYKDTFQHGGISLEEVIIPLISLTPRNAS